MTNNYLAFNNTNEMTFDQMKVQAENLILQMAIHVQSELAQVSKLATETSRRQTEFELRSSKKFEEVSSSISDSNDKFDDIEQKAQTAIDLVTSERNVQQIVDSYVNQSDLGSHFKVKISSIRIGKLLRIVGLAQKSRKTKPYHSKTPTYAKQTQTIEGYVYYKWNQKTCLEAINKWLDKKNVFNDFYLIEHEDDMETFIDDMYLKYVVLKGEL